MQAHLATIADALAEVNGFIVASFDDEGRLLRGNDAWHGLDDWPQSLPPVLRSPPWSRARKGHDGSFTLGLPDGMSTDVVGAIVPVEGGLVLVARLPGDQVGAIRMIRLINRLESMHTKAVDTRREAERANADLTALIYGIVHDLRPVFSAMDLVMEGWDGEPLKSDQVGLVRGQLNASRTLVDGLVEYAKLGGMDPQVEPLSGSEMVATLQDEFRIQLTGVQGRLEAEQMEDFVADRVLIMQVFRNIIRNAIRYRAERDLVITWDAQAIGDGTRIRITDNGTGIDDDQAASMFDLLQRFSARSGSGIGLAFSRRIVERHGGTIRAVPMAPGCRIEIFLPTARP